ncbi:MAG: hypothetical protein GW855_11480 [Erythrobacter sp.]|nr:hypothetical protein [Erythrobacter sp.]NCQ62763.1 hypothetical protein [Alphaproteobacteria bacterium]
MDPTKRKQLEARRAALREAPPRKVEGTIIPRLAARGIAHEPRFDGIWTPPYLRVSGNGIWWPDCPAPADSDHCWLNDKIDPKGTLTAQKRIDVIKRMIEQATGPDTLIRFNYDSGFETHVSLKAGDAIANLDVLLDFGWTIWITGYPENWLIELSRDNVAQLALPPELSAEEIARRDAMAQLFASPLPETLTELGIGYELIRDDDPRRPRRPRHVYNDTHGSEKETLRKIVDPGDIDGLQAMVNEFVEARCDADVTLVATVGMYGVPHNKVGSPYVLMPHTALLPAFHSLVAMGNRDIAQEPLAGVSLSHVELWSKTGDWLLTIQFDNPYWRIRAWG